MVVKHVGVWSAARIYAIICVAIGLIIGLFVALVSVAGGAMSASNSDMPSWAMPVFGIGSIVFFPIMYGVMGLVGGALSAALYNIGARFGGGLEIDVQ
jgi:hypothetical protein